jgi:hypothetical protein
MMLPFFDVVCLSSTQIQTTPAREIFPTEVTALPGINPGGGSNQKNEGKVTSAA